MPARRRSRSAAPSANVGTFAANGNASLGGNVTSTGTQTYAGAVALTGDAVLDAGIGKVDLQRAVDGGGHNLTLHERQCRGRCGASRQYGRQHGAAHRERPQQPSAATSRRAATSASTVRSR
jgi:hypothetical protein